MSVKSRLVRRAGAADRSVMDRAQSRAGPHPLVSAVIPPGCRGQDVHTELVWVPPDSKVTAPSIRE